MTRLDEYTKDEWFLVVRKLRPDITEEEFDAMWEGFCCAKQEHEKRKALN